ncbi:MAG: serine protease [Variovorax sp.]
MTHTPAVHLRRYRSQAAGTFCAVLMLGWPFEAAAQISLDALKHSIVLVYATQGGQTHAASGFLWQASPPSSANSFVITALHAVSGAMSVQCAGVTKKATVEKVLVDADLALLKTESAFGPPCVPLRVGIQKAKPPTDTPLKVLGFLAGARSLTDRDSVKGLADPETLEFLLREPVLSEQRNFRIPNIKLDIYYVKGGLLPGYSGGPVFNGRTGELVGIVDGGLDKGADAYNWVIPASNLEALLNSTVTQVPAQVATGGPAHFSSPIVEPLIAELTPRGNDPKPSGLPPVAALPNRAATLQFSQNGWDYSYVRTKTRSLAELARTADDPAGVMHLVRRFEPVVGPDAATRMMFDIYQEVNRGLIIALPAGQQLEFYTKGRYPNLKAEAPNWGTSEFEEPRLTTESGRPLPDEYEVFEASDGSGAVKASEPRFLQETVAELIAVGNVPGEWTATLDPGSLRIIDFGNGNKILKIGLSKHQISSPFDVYEYHTFAVRGKRVFHATTTIYSADDGLLTCATKRTALGCTHSPMAFGQLAQLVATHLTTFAGIANQAGPAVLETRFVYDNKADDPRTLRGAYYERGALRFYNRGGKVWEVRERKGSSLVLVARRSDENIVYLQSGNSDDWFAIPFLGGNYGVSNDGGRTFRKAGTLQRK